MYWASERERKREGEEESEITKVPENLPKNVITGIESAIGWYSADNTK